MKYIIFLFSILIIGLTGCGQINTHNDLQITNQTTSSSPSVSAQNLIKNTNVTDFAFIDENDEDVGPFTLGSYGGIQKCTDSIYAPVKQDNLVNLRSDVYAFIQISENGVVGDEIVAKWFFEIRHRPIDEDGEEDLSADFIHDGWKFMYEENIKIFTTCVGNLFAYSHIPTTTINQYFTDDGPLGKGGKYQVEFYQNNKKIGQQDFYGLFGYFDEEL